MPSIKEPIFILGSGRCGSTIFQEIFTHHPGVTFLSGLTKLYPDHPEYNRWAMRLMDVPLVGKYARKRFRPAEHWEFWDHYLRGFSECYRDLLADDVRPNEVRPITKVLEQMLTPKRDRLMIKLSGWPRARYLAKIFPDARFIHLIRDGRAVVNSLLNVDFWTGWKGPYRWQHGELTPAQREEWEHHGQSFVALAAIEWRVLMESFEDTEREISPSQFLTIRYEDLTADPQTTFGTVLDFCGLDYPERFRRAISRFDLRDTGYKWRSQLTPQQQKILHECLAESLVRYGYSQDGKENGETSKVLIPQAS
jgi:hypothetical protein